MKPEMFCRKISGMPRWSHSSMKWAPLSADSLNRTPLLATMPTGCPCSLAKPVTRVVPYSFLNSWNSAAVHQPGDHLAHVVGALHVGRNGAVQLADVGQRLDGWR